MAKAKKKQTVKKVVTKRRSHEQVLKAFQKANDGIVSGKFKTLADALKKCKLTPNQYYDLRKEKVNITPEKKPAAKRGNKASEEVNVYNKHDYKKDVITSLDVEIAVLALKLQKLSELKEFVETNY